MVKEEQGMFVSVNGKRFKDINDCIDYEIGLEKIKKYEKNKIFSLFRHNLLNLHCLLM